MFGFFIVNRLLAAVLAVSHQVFADFCLSSRTKEGHRFFLDGPGKQKKGFFGSICTKPKLQGLLTGSSEYRLRCAKGFRH